MNKILLTALLIGLIGFSGCDISVEEYREKCDKLEKQNDEVIHQLAVQRDIKMEKIDSSVGTLRNTKLSESEWRKLRGEADIKNRKISDELEKKVEKLENQLKKDILKLREDLGDNANTLMDGTKYYYN